MQKRLGIFILLIAGCLTRLDAQNLNGKNPFRMSIRAAGTVPHPMSNKAFQRSFTGIYDVAASFNVQVFQGIQVGIQYQHNLWRTPDNKIPGLNTYGQSHHGGFRVGYDHVLSETAVGYFAFSALSGRMRYYGISYTPDTSHVPLETSFTYRTYEVEAGVYFYTEGNFAIGLHISSQFTNFKFDPYKLYLDQHKAYIASDLNGKVSMFNFGFSLVFSFLKK
jgi:hypothetical protein